MATPKFYFKKSSKTLILKYSLQGFRFEYYTGIATEDRYYNNLYWKAKNAQKPLKATMPHAAIFNDLLRNMVTDLLQIEKEALSMRIPITQSYLATELDRIYKSAKLIEIPEYDFVSYYRKVIEERKNGTRLIVNGKNAGKRYRTQGIKNIGSTLAAVERYMKKARIRTLPFEQINREFYDNFRQFILVREEKEISTFGGFIKDIKTIMKEAKDDGLHNSTEHESKHFYMPAYESDTVALTLDQVETIHNLILKPDTILDRVRDLFLIGCYSALRFSDFIDLEIEDIQDNFIRVKQKKTGGYVTIPIMQRLKKVLEKYGNTLPRGCTNQEFNRTIKDVVKTSGLTQLIDVKTFKGGVEKVGKVPFYEMVSSHTARRSYATIMFRKGIPTMLIMSATGHQTEKSFLRYIRATNEDKSRMLAEVMKAMGL